MKVKLAAQTLSNSVAVALNYLDSLNLKEFADCKPTSRLIKTINDSFHFLNSGNFLGIGKKAPFSETNEFQSKKFAREAEIYISNLKVNGEKVIFSPRKTGFMGIKISIRSFIGLYDTLVKSEQPELKYLSALKLSKDHLEIFFSVIRALGGSDNNPTARQFETTYERLLMHVNVKGLVNGSCSNLENVQILSLNQKHIKLREDDEVSVEELNDDFPVVALTQYEQDVVSYITGFVINPLRAEYSWPMQLLRTARGRR